MISWTGDAAEEVRKLYEVHLPFVTCWYTAGSLTGAVGLGQLDWGSWTGAVGLGQLDWGSGTGAVGLRDSWTEAVGLVGEG